MEAHRAPVDGECRAIKKAPFRGPFSDQLRGQQIFQIAGMRFLIRQDIVQQRLGFRVTGEMR